MKPLTERQEKILVAMLNDSNRPEYGMTGNDLGYALGFDTGSDRSAHDGRTMGPAQRVIGSLRGLEMRGLICWAPRRGGRSGTAYGLTTAGEVEARKLAA